MFCSLKPKFNFPCFRKKALCTILALLFSSHIHAAAIGQPISTIQIGIGTHLNLVSINDELGKTRRKVATQPGSIFITDWLIDRTRYLGEIYTSKYSFEAEADTIGEQVENRGLRFSVQFNVKHWRQFSPWYGLGLDLSHANYTKRHKIDNEGFLIARYKDLSKPGINLLFSIMETWSASSNIDLGAKLEYSMPLTQTVNGLTFSALLIYTL